MSKKNAIDLMSKMRNRGVKSFLRQGRYRATAKSESDTGRLNLQERRMVTGARTALVNDMVDRLTNLTPDDADFQKKVADLVNMVSVLSMAGVLEKNDLVFDALAFEEECKVVPKEIQEQYPKEEWKNHTVPGFRRMSIAELLIDMRDMMEMVMDATYIHAEMYHEALMRQQFWLDENKVNRSPYKDFFQSDYLTRDEEDAPVLKEGEEGASTRAAEDNTVNLDKIREFAEKKG